MNSTKSPHPVNVFAGGRRFFTLPAPFRADSQGKRGAGSLGAMMALRLLPLLLLAEVALAGAPVVWVPDSNTVVRFYNQAVDALNRQDPARAAARARKAIEAQETYGEAHLVLGIALARQGQLDASIEVLAALDQRAPGRSAILTELAQVWFAKEDFARAEAHALDAVSRNPDELRAWQALTLVRRRTGAHDELRVELETEMGRSGQPEIACFQAQNLVDLNRPTDALAALQRCRESEQLAFVQNAVGALRKSGVDVGEADAPVSSSAELVNRGVAAYRAGELRRAEHLAGRALDAGAPPVVAALLRAQVRYDAGDFEGARADIDAVLGEGGTWVRLHEDGALTGVLTQQDADDVKVRLRGAAGVLALLHARAKDSESVTNAMIDARSALGDSAELRAAEALAMHTLGESRKGWGILRAAYEGGDDPTLLASTTTELGVGAAAVADDAVIAMVADRATPTAIYNAALGASNASLTARCLGLLESLRGKPGSSVATSEQFALERAEVAPSAASLEYACAVQGGRWDEARALGEAASWGAPLDPADIWAHSIRLYEEERSEELLRVLEASGLAEDEAYLGARDLVVHAHLSLGNLDAACSAVAVAGASEAAILEVGAALVPAGRQDEAKALLGPLCGKLEGDQATRCRKLLALLGD